MQNPIQIVFQLASAVISIYAMLCFVRIIITWFPGLNYSIIGQTLSQLCDPYLTLFSRLPLRLGMIDFSPVISLGLLTVASSILGGIAQTGKLYIAGIIAQLISMIWSAATSLIGVLLLVCFVRYCFAIFSKKSNDYNSPWQIIDNSISNIVFSIGKILSGGRPLDYKKALLFTCVVLLFLLISGNILIHILTKAIMMIPV